MKDALHYLTIDSATANRKSMQANENKRKQRAWNPTTRDLMISKGVDPAVSRLIYHVFYLTSQEKADQLLELLLLSGYSLERSYLFAMPDNAKPWTLVVTKAVIPDIESIDSMTDECIELSASVDEEYDGWYVEID